MAEAHSVSALSIQVTHDGVSVSYDQELLRDVWHAFSRSYRRRMARFKNDFMAGIFPANIKSLLFTILLLSGFSLLRCDLTFGIVPWVQSHVFYYILGKGALSQTVCLIICGSIMWFLAIQCVRLSLKLFLSYKGWMYENPFEQKVSRLTKLWLGILHLISKSEPMLHSFQGALPHLPLPSLNETLEKHLTSMRPWMSNDDYNEVVELTEKFRKGIGRRLQRYLVIKYWLSVNYVTDWWEEFVYLRQRSPIMINSNYYGFDTLYEPSTTSQAARAANLTWVALQFRRMIERQEVSPFSVNPRYKVPFCTMQYERLFNTSRIPGEEEDILKHYTDSHHIAVYSNGCWYKMAVDSGKRLLNPAELQTSFEWILNSRHSPVEGERHLAAVTASNRSQWARLRKEHFAKGVNKTSLHCIEKAAFVVILDDENVYYDPNDPSKLDRWAELLLHGKGNDRWFDKSFNFVISKNARFGVNVEHSWGDAAVTAHFVEYILLQDLHEQNYNSDGNTKGEIAIRLEPERLKWDFDSECQAVINEAMRSAEELISDVEISLLVWNEFGKGLIKKLSVSPDAFLQMALQLTYFRNQGHFCLTYEASMTRLYREGRTETVRSCTNESCDFVRSMMDANCSRQDRWDALLRACRAHQQKYKDAMCGRGVDRHLFALYVVKRYLEEESPFFDRIFPPSYLLSTSQTPLNQCEELSRNLSSEQKVRFVSVGGGFGPVTDRGYGVSYVIAGEHLITFHISSKKSATNTDSKRFKADLIKSLIEMRALFQ